MHETFTSLAAGSYLSWTWILSGQVQCTINELSVRSLKSRALSNCNQKFLPCLHDALMLSTWQQLC